MTKLTLIFCIFAAMAWGCVEVIAAPQTSYSREAILAAGNIHLAANDPRPLAQAVDALQQEYHWPISYEDPPYAAASDLTEIPSTDDPHKMMKVPGGHIFNVEFPPGKSPTAAPDEEKTLRLVIDAYNHSGNPGQFELTSIETRWDVIGRSARDEHGSSVKQDNPLDLNISLPSQARTGRDTIVALADAISEHSKFSVSVGVSPGFMKHVNLTVGGDNLSGRTLLARALAATGQQVVWRLLFDPESKSYVLMLHLVKRG